MWLLIKEGGLSIEIDLKKTQMWKLSESHLETVMINRVKIFLNVDIMSKQMDISSKNGNFF